jgi:chromosome partitioning protein
MHIMSIANQKGGVGKSTLSSLFAYFLADKKSAWVLAVDLDSQRNLSHTLRQCGIDIPTTALFADARIELPAVDASHTAVARRCHGIPVRTLSRSGSSRAVR